MCMVLNLFSWNEAKFNIVFIFCCSLMWNLFRSFGLFQVWLNSGYLNVLLNCINLPSLMQDSSKFILRGCLYLELPISGVSIFTIQMFYIVITFITYSISYWIMKCNCCMLALESDMGACWLISRQATFCMVPTCNEWLIHEWWRLLLWLSSNLKQPHILSFLRKTSGNS
jgi:hypothetical protein